MSLACHFIHPYGFERHLLEMFTERGIGGSQRRVMLGQSNRCHLSGIEQAKDHCPTTIVLGYMSVLAYVPTWETSLLHYPAFRLHTVNSARVEVKKADRVLLRIS